MSFLFGGTPFDGYDRGGRRTVNGGGDSGGGGNTTTTTTNIPDWLKDPAQRLVARGEEISKQPYQPYTGERVADFSPTQQAAFQQVYGMQTPGEYGAAAQGVSTGYGAAANAAGLGNQYAGAAAQRANAFNVGDFNAANFGVGLGTAAAASAADRANAYRAGQLGQSGQFDTAAAQQYMSPYQQAVTDIAKREAAVESQQANRMLAANAAKAGAFGGSRFGLEQAQVYKSGLQNLADIQTKGSQAAFENAQQQFERDRQARLGYFQAQEAANQFGANLGLQGSQLLASIGLQGAQTLAQQEQARENQRMSAEQLALQGSTLGANTALQGGQMESAAALQGAGLLTNLGTARQAADLQRIQALSAVGAQQQAQEQQRLDQAYTDFVNQRDFERQQLQFAMGLVRGTPYGTQSEVTAPAPSTTSQIAGLGLTGISLANLLK